MTKETEAVVDEMDDMKEIIDDFLVEADELVSSLDTNLVKLEISPNDLDLLNDVDSIGGEDATSPSARIHRAWINEQEGRVLQEESKRSRSKATLAALACLSKEGLASPAPITLQPLTPTNRLRIRMLCGTSSLNGDMFKIDGRSSSCPVCDDGLETVEHFLLGCSHRNFEACTASAKAACTCKGTQCVSLLEDASPALRMVFLLGGTADRPPCPSVDLVSSEYFSSAWVTRVKALQEDSESESSDSDTEPSGSRDLRDFFHPSGVVGLLNSESTRLLSSPISSPSFSSLRALDRKRAYQARLRILMPPPPPIVLNCTTRPNKFSGLEAHGGNARLMD
jgi:hypothetical protein